MSLLRRIERARPGEGGESPAPGHPAPTADGGGGGHTATPAPAAPAPNRPFLGAPPTRESFREAKYRVQSRLINEFDPRLDLSQPVEVRRQI